MRQLVGWRWSTGICTCPSPDRRGRARAVAAHQRRRWQQRQTPLRLDQVPLWRPGWPANVGFWLLARRSLSDPTDLAFYVCFAPADTPLVTLVQVAGCRWQV